MISIVDFIKYDLKKYKRIRNISYREDICEKLKILYNRKKQAHSITCHHVH